MCGIIGVVGDTDRLKPRFRTALTTIAHRGPDGEGVYAADRMIFGHRRLAIIDLGEGGYQPVIDPATGTVMTYNGEIYNYIEVRAELAALGVRFRTKSDVEVLLQAFIMWREEMFHRLNGMWAFAIWEPQTATLTLARDRFGVKPLYWHVERGTIAFASEAKALIALRPSLAEPDADAVFDLVVNSRSHVGDGSFYRNIRALPPATVATFRPGDAVPASTIYWHYPEPSGEPIDATRAGAEFTALFDDAVRLRLRSDVPVGLTLSGGLDSSAVLAAAQARSANPVRCFTSVYGADARGEERWARIASTAWGADLESVVADGDAWLPTLRRMVWHMDGPGYSPAIFPLWAIMARARATSVPVLLEGQGADELLAGYPQYGTVALAAEAGAAKLGAAYRTFRGLGRTFGPRQVALWLLRQQATPLFDRFGPHRRRRQMFPVADRKRDTATLPLGGGHGPLAEALHADHSQAILPSLLHYGDAISMAHGIETRLPFMDYRLVEWVYRSQPPLIVDGRTKVPVRDYLAAHRLQVIADRADKQGYPTMVGAWLNGDAGRELIGDLMATPGAPLWSIVDRSQVGSLVAASRRGASAATNHLYKLFATEIWLEGKAVEPTPVAAMPSLEPVGR